MEKYQKRGQDTAKVRKWTPRVSKSEPKGTKSEPKGSQSEPKGSQRVTKIHPKIELGAGIDFRCQKCDPLY